MARAAASRRILATGHRTRSRSWLADAMSSWPFLIPAIIFFVGWQVYPILRVIYLSFTDYHFLRVGDEVNFVGLRNYQDVLTDRLFWTGMLRAAIFTALFLPGMIFIPMVLAVMVDRITHPKLATFYRLILLIPSMIPGPLIFVLWKWLYDLYIGPINWFLVDFLGVYTVYNQPQWLGSERLVFPALAVMEWWWGLGYHTMFFLAGLAAVPRDIYDAARVDGANEWQLFWKITFQRLRPVILILVVLRFGTAMAVIDEYLIMGGFNRDRPTYTWTIYMWDVGFKIGDWNQSYAATIGWLGAIGMLIVVAGLFWVFRTKD
jgi:multiple sugar transport system permease protein